MDGMNLNYKALMDNLFDGVYFVDKTGTIRYWNRAAENITGFAADEVLGKRCSDNVPVHFDSDGHNLSKGLCPLEKSITDGAALETELYLCHKNGRRIPVAIRITPVRDSEGSIIGALELFSDISSKSATLLRIKELEKLSLTDPLTRLANRRFVESELSNRLQELARFKWPFGVLFMDIDHFKHFNDTYGHDVGDSILKTLANTVVGNTRPFDLFGRWGGEEFIGIMRNVDQKGLQYIGNRLRLLVEAACVVVEEKKMNVTVSLGGTMAKPDDTVEGLIKRADRLMFQSKKAGRNCLTVSD
ncbi:MAG: sensor domain-containing diguanylate cyclase [Pseudomonadota bacterium]